MWFNNQTNPLPVTKPIPGEIDEQAFHVRYSAVVPESLVFLERKGRRIRKKSPAFKVVGVECRCAFSSYWMSDVYLRVEDWTFEHHEARNYVGNAGPYLPFQLY